MLNPDLFKVKISALIAVLSGTTLIAPIMPVPSVQAQPNPIPRISAPAYTPAVIPTQTLIPIQYDEAETIRVAKGQVVPLTLKTAIDIRNRNGFLLIPQGSEIVGQLEPVDNGVRFVARELIINSNTWIPLEATSHVISTTETVRKGANTIDILKGTFAGAGTATIIAGVTGDRRIDALEVLGGAAAGTLAGWALPEAGMIGGKSQEVFVVNPNRDLTLTVAKAAELE